ncbi:unnamed protein product [Clonostachys rhizophaga]|uniref:F-box domain-containing protein n=1 Tax=Clonostachys rhizophaga TaxID=160324 RepID=A0A9N9V7U9_9HYPO|nr:unnamed protein product [Clonostachys rhizophaga]
MSRQTSESAATASFSGGSSKKWRLPMLKKIPSMRMKEDKSWSSSRASDIDSHDSLGLKGSDGHSSFVHEGSDNYRQLRDIVQRMRTAPTGPKDVDSAYEIYSKHKERAAALCLAIVQDEFRSRNQSSVVNDTLPRRDSSLESPNAALYDQRSSFSGRSLTEIVSGNSVGRSAHVNDAWLNAVREWKGYLDTLADALRTSLEETYRKHEHESTPDMVEAMFTNKRFRREAIHRMRNASVTRVMSQDPQFFPRYEIRFRNYEKVRQELVEIRGLLQSGESGISPDRRIEEVVISPKGDAVLEFANLHPEAVDSEPVLRFRVSSHMLAETSPIFAYIFSGNPTNYPTYDDDELHPHLPPPSTKYICKDGFEARLYRMPQLETNQLSSLEILLHAAHMHNDKVPRDVSFEQFVVIAECCVKYKCTSPLEMVVEHRWLPQWMHRGADDMPDGMLIISYAFGLRQIFTRMSKSAILNLVDEADLQSKPWPQRIREKIWAVRSAKIAQVHACCTSTIQEYIRQPSRNPVDDVHPITPSDLRNNQYQTTQEKKPLSTLSSTPRCPKGSHWCDASNLGWLMLVYNEMNILPQILRPNALSHLTEQDQQAPKSLAQMMEGLRRVPSPVSPVHQGGVCDPCTTFRAAINDIFNSVSGLTLHDVSGKSHGWALSRHRETEPQEVYKWGLSRMAGTDQAAHAVANEFPENVRLKILSDIDDLDDLHSAAMVNRVFYETYKTHELYLMRNILRAGRIRAGALPLKPVVPKSISNAEEKVPKEISDEMMREDSQADALDAMTIRTDDDDDLEFDDGESINGTPAPSISESLWREARLRQARSRTAGYPPEERHLRGRQGEPPYTAPPSDSPPSPFDDSNPTGTLTLESSLATTPRQASPAPTIPSSPKSASHVVLTEEVDEPPLTDEEARRILWPDDDPAKDPRPAQLAPEEGLREKFRFGDKSLFEGLEEKSLAFREDKHLLTGERAVQDPANGK